MNEWEWIPVSLWFVVTCTVSFREVGGGQEAPTISCLSRFHCSAVARTSDNICITLAYLDLYVCTGWSEKKGAKLSELSWNFPKLADWLCMGWSVCQAAAKAGNSNRGNFFLHQPV